MELEASYLFTADDLKLPNGSRLFTACLGMKDDERRGGLLGLLELEEEAGVLGTLLLGCCPILVECGVMLIPAGVAVAIAIGMHA